MINDYLKEVNVALTVCDLNGIILYMNEKAQKTFSAYGGAQLIGKSLFDCHKPSSVAKIKELLANNSTNAYTISKNGIKKLIYQTPWYENEQIAGLCEYSLEISEAMPHFIRN
jgi:transcriptional regulator with PAS, ATPase and Fis domain